MVTVGDGLGPNGAANRFLRLFVLANTPLHVSHARWGRRVASSTQGASADVLDFYQTWIVNP